MKKSWNKPELIVLVKKKSDEEILLGCKEGSVSDTSTKIDSCYVTSHEFSDPGIKEVRTKSCK